MISFVRTIAAVVAVGATTACMGGASTTLPTVALAFTPIASGLVRPTVVTHAGDGSGRLFIVEQAGKIRMLSSGGTLSTAPFLDISSRVLSGGERGLLGLAFPPAFSSKKYFYVNYTRVPDGATVVSRFFVSAAPDTAMPGSEEIILVVGQPYANHNGGQIAFGSDDLLYIGLGDGGSGGDPHGNGQNPSTLLGKLLRIDVEGGVAPYRIPADNPFVTNSTARHEIWALGLRNPWRFSFDRLTGDLYLADVGQNTWEEIDFQSAAAGGGTNYGWNTLEGPDCFLPATGCAAPPAYSAPVTSYQHNLGCSVTGGYVYHGPGNAGMQGLYFYGDFCSGRLWGLRKTGSGWQADMLTKTNYTISTFGEDEPGRLYVADYGTGIIYRIDQDQGM